MTPKCLSLALNYLLNSTPVCSSFYPTSPLTYVKLNMSGPDILFPSAPHCLLPEFPTSVNGATSHLVTQVKNPGSTLTPHTTARVALLQHKSHHITLLLKCHHIMV